MRTKRTDEPEHNRHQVKAAFRPKPKTILAVLVPSVAAIGLLLAGAAVKRPSSSAVLDSAPGELVVESIQVEQLQGYVVNRKYTGTVRAKRESDIGFELGGKIERLLVDQGGTVSKGHDLAVLDTQHLKTQRVEQMARLEQAKAILSELTAGPRLEVIGAARSHVATLDAQVKLLELEFARHKKLVEPQAISVSEYDRTRFNLASRRAEHEHAKQRLLELTNGTRAEVLQTQRAKVGEIQASLARIDVQIQKSTLRAPFDGTLAKRFVDEGTVVQAGLSVFRILEDDRLEAWIGVPARIANELLPGGERQVEVNGESFSARITSLIPEIDPATQTRTVILDLEPQAAAMLVAGQVVRLTLGQEIESSGFWLPIAALQKDTRGLWTCFALQESHSRRPTVGKTDLSVGRTGLWAVAPRLVEVLHVDDGKAFVRGTLSSGERIVKHGVHRIVAGQLVRTGGEQRYVSR